MKRLDWPAMRCISFGLTRTWRLRIPLDRRKQSSAIARGGSYGSEARRLVAATLPACVMFALPAAFAATREFARKGVELQVLGSGGPGSEDKRASTSYLLWQDGRPRVLIDSGGGSALNFGRSGAHVAQLDAILFTHLHIDHSADFPALINSSYFEERKEPLPVYGPTGMTPSRPPRSSSPLCSTPGTEPTATWLTSWPVTKEVTNWSSTTCHWLRRKSVLSSKRRIWWPRRLP